MKLNLPKKMWNEEYFLQFELNGKKFSSACGEGFDFVFDLRNEISRLCLKGAKILKVGIRKWC